MRNCNLDEVIDAWLADTVNRIYPTTLPARSRDQPGLELARGERGSLQVGFRSSAASGIALIKVDAPDGLAVTVRRVGFVPVQHFNVETPASDLEGPGALPGLVPDPLFPDPETHFGPYETNAFWITVAPDKDLPAGRYPVRLELVVQSGTETRIPFETAVVVRNAVLPGRQDFAAGHILHADALCDYYGVQPFSEAFWQILEPYVRDYTEHGMDCLLVPLITPPLDGVKRPIQLLGVADHGGRYEFDWTQVLRWLRLARKYGVRVFEWTHLFTQWGVEHAARIYRGHGETEQPLWPDGTPATAPEFRAFLDALMPELRRVLEAEGILGQSLFHISDEPESEHRENYRVARTIMREVAPWATVIDSLSDVEFAREGLVDIPVPQVDSAPSFREQGFDSWVYYCCVPRGRYLNKFLDTPLAKIRMSGWLFHRDGAGGFGHWGYNYWYQGGTRTLIDPFTVNDAGKWPQWGPGDPFVVYPGERGPIDSLRWEVFAESLQDLALLRSHGQHANRLDEIKDYAEFPRDPSWVRHRRSEIFDAIDAEQ